MKKILFTNEMGSRRRDTVFAVSFNGVIYDVENAEKNKLCVLRELSHSKNGIWSYSKYEITLNTANFIICMSPFNGWSDILDDCVKHIIEYTKEITGYIITEVEATKFFQTCYPETFGRVMDLINAEKELL